MNFAAEIAQTKYEKHPLLIYRLPTNQDLCFKFKYLRSNNNSNGYSYVCVGCKQAQKLSDGITVNSLRVSNDYTSFLSDPEELNHVCQEKGFIFYYLDANVQQVYR